MTTTSLIASLGATWPDSKVILDEKFEYGPGIFRQLVSSTSPVGMLNWQPSSEGGELVLCTGNQSDGALSTAPMGECSAYGRVSEYMANADESVKLSLEVWWGWQALYGKTRFRAFEFGLDHAFADGTRFYPVYRWLNCDDSEDATRDCRWYVQTGNNASPAFTALPGPDSASVIASGFVTPTDEIQTELPYNENKRNWIYSRGTFIYNANKTFEYDGLQVNHRGFGSLASPPDTTFRSYSPTTEALTDFAQGLNIGLTVRNRTNASLTAARVFIKRVRLAVMS